MKIKKRNPAVIASVILFILIGMLIICSKSVFAIEIHNDLASIKENEITDLQINPLTDKYYQEIEYIDHNVIAIKTTITNKYGKPFLVNSVLNSSDFDNSYLTQVAYVTYDPIGSSKYVTFARVKIVVYVQTTYYSGTKWMKPVYYTQELTEVDTMFGNPYALVTTGHFTGIYGTVPDGPDAYFKRFNISNFTTFGQSQGTKYTNINQFYLNSTGRCWFNISLFWEGKQGDQEILSEISVW